MYISITELSKTSTAHRHEPEIVISKFTNTKLCCVHYLRTYLEATISFRNEPSKLFLSFAKPHKAITTNTLARWIRFVMVASGVNVARFRPHSLRSAASSKAVERNVSLATILASVGWRTESTFAKFYRKPVVNNQGFFSKALEPSE